MSCTRVSGCYERSLRSKRARRHCALSHSDMRRSRVLSISLALLACTFVAILAVLTLLGCSSIGAAACFATVVAMYFHRLLSKLVSYAPNLAAPLGPTCNSPTAAEQFIKERDESAAGPLQSVGTSSVHWSDAHGVQTDFCVVFMHGWSASPLELDPLDMRIAEALGANLLRFRLTGHGMRSGGAEAMLKQSSRETLLRDAAEAFACAKLLGKRVILFGSSYAHTLPSALHLPQSLPVSARVAPAGLLLSLSLPAFSSSPPLLLHLFFSIPS